MKGFLLLQRARGTTVDRKMVDDGYQKCILNLVHLIAPQIKMKIPQQALTIKMKPVTLLLLLSLRDVVIPNCF